MRVLDTNVVSYIVKQHPLAAIYRPHIDGYALAVSFQTLGELLEWSKRSNMSKQRRARLDTLLKQTTMYYPDRGIVELWAEVRVARRRQPISVDDAWIAATALSYGVELVTHNPADFAGIPGLVVVSEAP